jgi:hypothetical protein
MNEKKKLESQLFILQRKMGTYQGNKYALAKKIQAIRDRLRKIYWQEYLSQ